MNISAAFSILLNGGYVRRKGWNGPGQYVFLETAEDLIDTSRSDTHVGYEAFFVLKNAQGKFQPGWVPSQGDMTADDWVEVFL